MKKEPLSIMIVKTLLAVIIFAGIVIIINTLFTINSKQKISTFCEGLMSVEECAGELEEPFSSLLLQSKLKNDVFLYENNKKIIFFTDINCCANLEISFVAQENDKTVIQLLEKGNRCHGGYNLQKVEIKVKEPIQKNNLEIYKELEFLKDNFQNLQIYPDSKSEKKPEKIVENDRTIYSNKEFGFQLALTKNWQDYKTEIEIADYSTIIRFSAPTNFFNSYNSGYSELFNISVNNIKDWDKNAKSCIEDPNSGMCDWIDSEIARNDKYVFSYGVINGDCPEDQKEAFNDIQKIIDTFKFIEK